MVEREFLNDKGHFHVHLWQTPSLHREAGTCIKHVGYSLMYILCGEFVVSP